MSLRLKISRLFRSSATALLACATLALPALAINLRNVSVSINRDGRLCNDSNFRVGFTIAFHQGTNASQIYITDSNRNILYTRDYGGSASASSVGFYTNVADLPKWDGNLYLVYQDRSVDPVVYTGQVPTLSDSIAFNLFRAFTLKDFDPNCTIPVPQPPPQDTTGEAVGDFLSTRTSILGNSVRPTSQRIARLNGAQRNSTPNGGDVLNYVSSFVATGAMPVSASLSAIAAMDQTNNTFDNPFDAWVEGTISLLETKAGNGRASSISAGADYRVTPDLLLGGFVAVDNLASFETPSGTMSGLGWMVGPYVIARLSDQLYLDLTAGAGRSSNTNATSTGDDHFDTTRAYANATLQGHFGEEAVRFTPRLGLKYAGEWADAFTNHKGIAVDAVSNTSAAVFAGPGVTFTDAGDDLTRSLTLRADANTSVGQSSQFSAALEAAVEFNFANGLGLSARTNWSGLGTENKALNLSLKASAAF
jgi:hypothetical protein